MRRHQRIVMLERCVSALTKVIRDEVGDYPMSYIADTWGRGPTPCREEGVTDEEVEALRQYEEEYAERPATE